MGGAFAYLTVCSLRNRVRVRLRRLREPRYLVGLIVGLLYLRFLVFRRPPRRSPDQAMPDVAPYLGAVEIIGAMGLLAAAALAWALPGSRRPALTFTPADVQFLFAAPVSRRQLIRYKILRSQGAAVIGSALIAFLFASTRLVAGWRFFVGTLVLMVTINLYVTGVSLRRESLGAHGWAGIHRHWVPLVLLGGAAIVLVTGLAAAWRTDDLDQPAQLLRQIEQTGARGLLQLVLFPFVAMVRLPLSDSSGEFLRTLPLALALLAANYAWVVRSDTAFEEAAARFAEQQAAWKAGTGRTPPAPRRRPPFALALDGRAEVAFLWKNLILAGRYATPTAFLSALPLVVLVGFVIAQSARTAAETLAGVCLVLAAGVVLFGPHVARNDLRQDLTQLSALKAWPIRGAVVVRGEVLAPTVLLSAVVWLGIVAAALLSTSIPADRTMNLASRLSYAAGAMMLAPAVILVQVVAQNGLALMFPAWVDVGSRSRGVDVMGQRMLVAGALLIAVGVAVVPAAIAGAAVAWAIHALTGLVPVLLPAAAALVVLLSECVLAIEALGTLLDRMDVTAVGPAE